jgi:hypothetical protein
LKYKQGLPASFSQANGNESVAAGDVARDALQSAVSADVQVPGSALQASDRVTEKQPASALQEQRRRKALMRDLDNDFQVHLLLRDIVYLFLVLCFVSRENYSIYVLYDFQVHLLLRSIVYLVLNLFLMSRDEYLCCLCAQTADYRTLAQHTSRLQLPLCLLEAAITSIIVTASVLFVSLEAFPARRCLEMFRAVDLPCLRVCHLSMSSKYQI